MYERGLPPCPRTLRIRLVWTMLVGNVGRHHSLTQVPGDAKGAERLRQQAAEAARPARAAAAAAAAVDAAAMGAAQRAFVRDKLRMQVRQRTPRLFSPGGLLAPGDETAIATHAAGPRQCVGWGIQRRLPRSHLLVGP